MSAVKWAGTEISLRKSYFIIMAPAIITLCTLSPKPRECYNNNNNTAMAKNGHKPDRIFTVNALAIPAAWALVGQIAQRVMWVLSFEFPLICPFQFAALISFSAKKNSRYLLCVKMSPAAIKPKGEGQKRRDKLQGSSLGHLLWAFLRTEGGFPPTVRTEVTGRGHSPVPWTATGCGPGLGAPLLLKCPPSYFLF